MDDLLQVRILFAQNNQILEQLFSVKFCGLILAVLAAFGELRSRVFVEYSDSVAVGDASRLQDQL